MIIIMTIIKIIIINYVSYSHHLCRDIVIEAGSQKREVDFPR